MNGIPHDEAGFLSACDAARHFASGELSPLELTRALLERVEALNPRLHAFVHVTAERALDEAREAEGRYRRGTQRGPLDGVPFALKDIYDTAGVPTTGHSHLLAGRVPLHDSACAARLRAAGAVLLGKLATHEFATGGPAWDLPWPPACNPWCLDRFPGGSSSGPAAAVAGGLVPFALGSDTGGSIRLPAAFCGIAGIKPGYGRVSKRGVLPLSWTLDNCGPLGRSVADVAAVLGAIAGHDVLDPASAPLPVPDYGAALRTDLRGLRIGVVRHFYQDRHRADTQTTTAIDTALTVLGELGAELCEVTLPALDDYQACYRLIVAAEALALHLPDLQANAALYSRVTRYRLLPGLLVSGADHVAALRWQRQLVERTAAAMQGVHALVTAITYGPPPVQAAMDMRAGFATPPLSNPFNVAQLPAISVCTGFSDDGLPLAMQIAGHALDEATVLGIAHAYEQATGWHLHRPGFSPGEGAAVTEPGPPPAVSDSAIAHCRQLVQGASLSLQDAELADLAALLPLFAEMRARLPRGRDLQTSPSTVYPPPS